MSLKKLSTRGKVPMTGLIIALLLLCAQSTFAQNTPIPVFEGFNALRDFRGNGDGHGGIITISKKPSDPIPNVTVTVYGGVLVSPNPTKDDWADNMLTVEFGCRPNGSGTGSQKTKGQIVMTVEFPALRAPTVVRRRAHSMTFFTCCKDDFTGYLRPMYNPPTPGQCES